MSDGTETLDLNTPDLPASGEVETSSLPADNASDEVHDLEALSEEGQAEDDYSDPNEDEEEFDHNGKKYRINKELKPLLMFQQDYTKKTQTVAEERKALESERETLKQQAEAVKLIDEGEKRLWAVDERLGQYAKINWQQLEQEDPFAAQARWREYSQLKDYRGNVAAKVDEAKTQRSDSEQLERAKRVQEAELTASQIKGWTPETSQKVASHTQSYGISQQQLGKLIEEYGGPIVKLAHDAWLGRQIVQKQQTAAKTPATPQEPVKPLAQVASRGSSPSARKPLAAMSMDEYAAARQAGRSV